MSTSDTTLGEFVSRLRQEMYTGSNRCWPCTGLNVGLLTCLSILSSIFITPFFGIVSFLIGLTAIWL